MTEIVGVTMGLPDALPKVRSGFQPKPFHRPRIDLDSRERRDWVRKEAVDIRPGDVLPGVGVVSTVDTTFLMPGRDTLPLTHTGRPTPIPVLVRGGEDNVKVFDALDVVLVFTGVDN